MASAGTRSFLDALDEPALVIDRGIVRYANAAAGIVPVFHTDVGQSCGTYNDFDGNIGIVGTPVIDQTNQTMFLVARTKENGTYVQRLTAHREALKELAARQNWSFAVHHTDHSPQAALAALHQVLTGHRR